MHTEHELAELAVELRSASRAGRGRPYPARLRERVVAMVASRAEAGDSEMRMARALGLPYRTIDRWKRRRGESELVRAR